MIQKVGEVISFCPSTGGFKSLRAMAYHPATEAFYVPLNLNCETAAFLGVEQREGGGGAGGVRDKQYHFHPKSPNDIGEFARRQHAHGRGVLGATAGTRRTTLRR